MRGRVTGSRRIYSENSTPVPIAKTAPNPITEESVLEPVATAFSYRGRLKKVSKNLMENQSNSGSRLKYALGVIVTISTYTLHAPHFAYAEYKRHHFERRVSFHANTLHHLEVINMNAYSTYNYMHPLSFTTSKGNNETYYFHQAMKHDDREDFINSMIK